MICHRLPGSKTPGSISETGRVEEGYIDGIGQFH